MSANSLNFGTFTMILRAGRLNLTLSKGRFKGLFARKFARKSPDENPQSAPTHFKRGFGENVA